MAAETNIILEYQNCHFFQKINTTKNKKYIKKETIANLEKKLNIVNTQQVKINK